MKAAVYHGPGDIRLETAPKPVPGPRDALVRTGWVGLCGTDIKTFLRGHPMFKPPCILGHELVGRLEQLGPECTGVQAAVGDMVAVAPYVPCNHCRLCLKGREELCSQKAGIEGAFCEYVLVPHEVAVQGLVRVPESLDPRSACLAEPLACCLNALEDTPLDPGDTVLIVGAGPMGLLMLELAKTCGAGRIFVSEPNECRRGEAGARGAAVINPMDRPLKEWVGEQTGGLGVDAVFVCVGLPSALEAVWEAVRPGGTVNIFGGLPTGSHVDLDPNRVHYAEMVITGSFGFAPRHFRRALDLLAAGRFNVDTVISGEFPLEQIADAFQAGASGEAFKVLIRMDGNA